MSHRPGAAVVLVVLGLACGDDSGGRPIDGSADRPVDVADDLGAPTDSADGGDVAGDGSPPTASCQKLWTLLYNGGGNDVGVAIASDSGGNVLVAGTSSPKHAPVDSNIWIRKYDGAASELWSRSFDSGGVDEARAVTIDHNGAIVAVGWANGRSWVRKYDAAGAELWTRGGGPIGADDVAVDAEGNAVVVAHDLAVTKYDGNGSESWRREGVARPFDLPSVAVAAGGHIAVAGTVNTADGGSVGSETTPEDIWIRRYDGQGNELWTRSFDGGASDRASDVTFDRDGNVYAIGRSFGPVERQGMAHAGWRRWLRKYSAAGEVLWTVLEDAPVGKLVVQADGSLLVVGWLQLARNDGQGTALHTKTCTGGPPADIREVSVGGVALDPQGHLLLIGTVLEPVDPNLTPVFSDIWLGKFAAP
jgi:hypothetical protein